VLGVTNESPRQVCGTRYKESVDALNKLKHEIAQHTNHQLTFHEIHEMHADGKRVLLFQIPAAINGVPTEWRGRVYEQLRAKAMAGRQGNIEGLTREATTFYDHVADLAFGPDGVPAQHQPAMKKLMSRIVELLQDTIGILDFWKKPIEVKKLRGQIATELLLTNLPQIVEKHERLAVEIAKLAEKRHDELTK